MEESLHRIQTVFHSDPWHWLDAWYFFALAGVSSATETWCLLSLQLRGPVAGQAGRGCQHSQESGRRNIQVKILTKMTVQRDNCGLGLVPIPVPLLVIKVTGPGSLAPLAPPPPRVRPWYLMGCGSWLINYQLLIISDLDASNNNDYPWFQAEPCLQRLYSEANECRGMCCI